MRKTLRGVLARFLRWLRSNGSERRSAAARARFWTEVREGEREAEASAHP